MIVFRNVYDTIHVVLLTYFYFHLILVVRDKTRNRKIVKHFYFELIFDVISGAEVNNIGFRTTNVNVSYLSNAV